MSYTVLYQHTDGSVKFCQSGFEDVDFACAYIRELQSATSVCDIEDIAPITVSDLDIDLVQSIIKVRGYIITPDVFAHYITD